MGYYVVAGKGITTARGVITAESDRPEVTPKCLHKGVSTPEQLAAADKRQKEHRAVAALLISRDDGDRFVALELRPA